MWMCFFCDALLLFSVLLSLRERALERRTTCRRKLLKIGRTTTKGCFFSDTFSHKCEFCCWEMWLFHQCSSWIKLFWQVIIGLLNGPVLFCSLASVICRRHLSSSVTLPPVAWAVGWPTLHGEPVQLRPVRVTPILFCSCMFFHVRFSSAAVMLKLA